MNAHMPTVALSNDASLVMGPLLARHTFREIPERATTTHGRDA